MAVFTQMRFWIGAVYYDWRTQEFPDRNFSKEKQIGVIAQEVEKEFPELVETNGDGYKSVDYTKLTPILIEAVKTQQSQIKELKDEISELKKETYSPRFSKKE